MENRKPTVTITTMTIKDIVDAQKSVAATEKQFDILLQVINKDLPAGQKYTGISDGSFVLFGHDKGQVIFWEDFMKMEVPVGNIAI